MKETMKTWRAFFVWNFDKEEAWLNEMAANGWVLEEVKFLRYTFVRCEPGEYTVRMEMRDDDPEYFELLRESGVEYVGHVTRWRYYRKSTALGPFEIFSDLESRIAHLERIGKMLFGIGMANLLIGVTNSINPTHFGWINVLAATLLMYAYGRIQGRKDELKKARILHE